MKTKRIAVTAAVLLMLAVGLFAFPRPLAGTEWRLISLDGTPPDATPITLAFNMTLLGPTMYGNGGCNDYSSGYFRVSNRLLIPSPFIGGVLVTGMACERITPPEGLIMEQEGRYITVVNDVTRYAVRDGRLHLTTPDGRTLIYESAGP